MRQSLFFGCWGNPGHHWFRVSGKWLVSANRDVPAAFERIDGMYAPKIGREEAPQGEATVTTADGWTCLAFWDRSGDKRGASNSAFVLPGEMTFDQALAAAKEAFPMVFARFPFEITKAKRATTDRVGEETR